MRKLKNFFTKLHTSTKRNYVKYLHFHDIRKKLKYKKKQFDLVISLGTLHNLENFSLSLALKEIERVEKKSKFNFQKDESIKC